MSTNATHNYRKINYGNFIMSEGTNPGYPWDPLRWSIMVAVATSRITQRYMWPMGDKGRVLGLVSRPTKDEWEAVRAWVAGMLKGDSSVPYPKVAEGRVEK